MTDRTGLIGKYFWIKPFMIPDGHRMRGDFEISTFAVEDWLTVRAIQFESAHRPEKPALCHCGKPVSPGNPTCSLECYKSGPQERTFCECTEVGYMHPRGCAGCIEAVPVKTVSYEKEK